MKVLIYSFDIMLGNKLGDIFFSTVIMKIKKNILTDRYDVTESQIKEYVYNKYPSLRNKVWHIEENPKDTFITDKI